MKISRILPTSILDSRGESTLSVTLTFDDNTTETASVPNGKSTGSREAAMYPEGGITDALLTNVHEALREVSVDTLQNVDSAMIALDGTETKTHVGAALMLGISVATARKLAAREQKPLWKYIAGESGSTPSMPTLFVNLINGGAHAGNNLPFQEYMALIAANDIEKAVSNAVLLRKTLGEILELEKGSGATLIGDEGGYGPDCADPLLPFSYLHQAVEKAGLTDINYGLDAAATGIGLSNDELTEAYGAMKDQYALSYLEDPFDENDLASHAALTGTLGGTTIIAGDDLTVTNPTRTSEVALANAVNGIIIKPNQIGTLTEAIAAVNAARSHGWKIIASHRSGETNDDWIADFAYGIGAYGFKLGAPVRGERVAKYNRLREIGRETK